MVPAGSFGRPQHVVLTKLRRSSNDWLLLLEFSGVNATPGKRCRPAGAGGWGGAGGSKDFAPAGASSPRRHSQTLSSRCQNLSATAGRRATILRTPAAVAGSHSMPAHGLAIIARTRRRLPGLLHPPPGLHQPGRELLESFRVFIPPLRGL